MKNRVLVYLLALLILPATLLVGGCSEANQEATESPESADPAQQSYVPPGEHDEYYLFYSGGHSSNVRVAGIPSMRHIKTIPVFAPDPAYGWGYDDKSEEMLGEFTWGDVHHPALSQTDGTYDGRWLFVNDNAHNRVARIDLEDFKTKQILGPIPNTSGNHGSSFVTPNTEYLIGGSRFATPLPKGETARPSEYEEEYKGVITGIDIDQSNDGHMEVAWQIKTPPFQWDLSEAGRGPSDGWFFVTSYNTEMAHEQLEAGASQLDQDMSAWINWERAQEAVENGQYEVIDGVPVIDPTEVDGLMYYVPLAKSPHGMDVDPTGRWIVGGGKLEPGNTVFDFEEFLAAVEEEDFQDEVRGIPVVNHDRVARGIVPTGLGPLHTEFDGRGNAYTTLFIDSKIAKFELPPWTEEQKEDLEKAVVDRIDVHYNPGHLVAGGSDTLEPYGDWLISMNKHAAGRHLPTGPSIPETSQLIDISGEEMRMVTEAFTDKEPHFAQVLDADVIDPKDYYAKENNDHSHQIWSPSEASAERSGDTVEVEMMAVRSRFAPDNLNFKVGDTVRFHITNTEQTAGMTHGFGVGEHDTNISVDPGQTKTVTIEMDEPGVYPFYCTVFCSALHQEMQGYFVVHPEDEYPGDDALTGS